MNKSLPIAVGGIVLVSLLAWSSLVVAAPAAKTTPVPHRTAIATPAKSTPLSHRTATATPVPSATTGGQTVSPDDGPDAQVDATGATPINPGTMTSSIFVFNPGTGTATVGITIYKSDGTIAYSFPTFPVAANGAVAKSLPSSISSQFAGSAVVSSDKNVQAFVTDFNGKKTARDEYRWDAFDELQSSPPLRPPSCPEYAEQHHRRAEHGRRACRHHAAIV